MLRAVDFLAILVASSAQRDFLYFGDIERDGIEIPKLLDQRLHERTAHDSGGTILRMAAKGCRQWGDSLGTKANPVV